MRCQSCGRQAAVGAAQCAACGDPLHSMVAAADQRVPMLPAEWPGQMPAMRDLPFPISAAPAPTNAMARPVPQAVVTRSAPARHRQPSNEVHGRVILVEGPITEPAGFDATLLLCQLLWLGLLLVLPLLVLHAVVSLLIVAPSLLLLLAIAWFLGLISPRHFLETISLIFRMGQWSHSGGETIPVRYLRIRDLEDDGESLVRLVGHLSAANVLVDDVVTFCGRQRRGVLYATHGRNLRTGSGIQIWRNRSRLLLAVTLVVYGIVIAAFFAVAGCPQLTDAR